MGDLRNKLRKLTRIFFTGAYYEYDFGTEDEIMEKLLRALILYCMSTLQKNNLYRYY